MNHSPTIPVLGAAFLAVFASAAFGGVRQLLGAQIDLLPGLMVYASLKTDFKTVGALALFGGLCFDSLSATPLGLSILPLLAIGLGLFAAREFLLRDELFAHLLFGFVASALAPALTLVLLLSSGNPPLLGWGTLWQIAVMAIGGAAVTPLWFHLFGWLERHLRHHQLTQTSFRPDREIRRGRA
jgi:cell shape-determining protein MreD